MHTARCQLALLIVLALFRPVCAKAAIEPPQHGVNLDGSSKPAETAARPADSSVSVANGTISIQELSIPARARSAFEKGRRLLMDEHRAEESLPSLHKAVHIAPAYWEAAFLLGVAYMELRKWSDAERPLRQSIATNGGSGAAYLALGSCLLEEGKYPEAEEHLLKGLDLDPEAAHGRYDLSRTYYALGRFEDAKLHALKAIDLEPKQADAHFLLANILLLLDEKPGALAEFRECLRLAPAPPLAWLAQHQASRLQSPDTSSR